MTVPNTPDPTNPVFPGTAEPSSAHDPEAAETYAEQAGVDPTPDQIEAYKEILGDPSGT